MLACTVRCAKNTTRKVLKNLFLYGRNTVIKLVVPFIRGKQIILGDRFSCVSVINVLRSNFTQKTNQTGE